MVAVSAVSACRQNAAKSRKHFIDAFEYKCNVAAAETPYHQSKARHIFQETPVCYSMETISFLFWLQEITIVVVVSTNWSQVPGSGASYPGPRYRGLGPVPGSRFRDLGPDTQD